MWSGEKCCDVAATVTSNETTIHVRVGTGSKEESLIVAGPEAAVRGGSLLSLACLTANAMPCWMALLGVYLRSHLDSEKLQKSH